MARYTEEPSTAFSNGTEYEIFMDNFCDRCKNGIRREDYFPEFPENGGCPIWDAMENARFDRKCFPSKDIVRLSSTDGKVKYWNVCKKFEAKDERVMAAYRRQFDTEYEKEASRES